MSDIMDFWRNEWNKVTDTSELFGESKPKKKKKNENEVRTIKTVFISKWSGKTLFEKIEFDESGNDEYLINSSLYIRSIDDYSNYITKLRASSGEEIDELDYNSDPIKVSLYSESILVRVDIESIKTCLTTISIDKKRGGKSIEQAFVIYFDKENNIIQAIMEDDSKNTEDRFIIEIQKSTNTYTTRSENNNQCIISSFHSHPSVSSEQNTTSTSTNNTGSSTIIQFGTTTTTYNQPGTSEKDREFAYNSIAPCYAMEIFNRKNRISVVTAQGMPYLHITKLNDIMEGKFDILDNVLKLNEK